MHTARQASRVVSPADFDEDRPTTSAPRAVAIAAGRFFWRNRVYVARDLLVALLWVGVLSAAFVVVPLPGWLYYVLLFGGLVAYSLAASLLGVAAKLQR